MKKGQIQIQETILVLFIFIIILILGMIFFYRYNVQSLRDSVFEIELNKFDSMLSTFPQSPEIRCSFLGGDISCVDSYKLISFKNLAENEKGYYRNRLGFRNITFYSLYPDKNNKECNVNSVKDCGVYSVYLQKPRNYKQTLVRKTPISIYFPDKDEYGIGEMVIEWYI